MGRFTVHMNLNAGCRAMPERSCLLAVTVVQADDQDAETFD